VRTAILGLLVLLLLSPAVLADAEADFAVAAEKTRRAVARDHVQLAKQARRVGMNVAARAELDAALELVPKYAPAMEELGYRRKRVEGEETWVLDEAKALPQADAESVSDGDRRQYASHRATMCAEAAQEFVKLAREAAKLKLESHARAVSEVALRYDPGNVDALKGAGWAQVDGKWISPGEQAERQATSEALNAVPEIKAVDTLPEWTSRVFAEGVWAVQAGNVTVIGTGRRHKEAARLAHATISLATGLLGGEAGDLRVVLCPSEGEFHKYCNVRHPGIPGLLDETFVIEKTEIAVRIPDETALADERVVYASARSQVLRRCEKARHPWFSVGFSTNLSQRLASGVRCAEFAGESTGDNDQARWRTELRNLIDSGKAPSVTDVVVARNPGEREIMLAHFFAQYLCRERPAGLPAFCAGIKVDGDDEGALKQAYGEESGAIGRQFLDWFTRR
jgi:hypothetical protein